MISTIHHDFTLCGMGAMIMNTDEFNYLYAIVGTI